MLFGSKTVSNKAVKVLSPADFKTAITKKNIQLVDVRTANEFKSKHLKNAVNIDFFSSKFLDTVSKLNKDKALYIYCRSGSRSRQASNKIAALGFVEIYDLQGGILNCK
jgi:rhodanese-related sulfurtransferase